MAKSWMLALCAVLALGACERKAAHAPFPSPVLARVGDFALTEADLEEELARLPQAMRAHAREEELRRRVADALIKRLALAAAAKAEGLDRDPKVQRAIARAKARILAEALRARVAAEVPTPSEEELRRRYEAEKAHYQIPARVKLAVMVVPDARTARRLARRLKRHPERFAAYARRLADKESTTEHAPRWYALAELPDRVREAIQGLREGEVSEPLRSEHGWAIYQVVAREEAHVLPFAAVREEIAAEIVHERIKRRLDELARRVPVKWLVPKNAP